MSTYQPTRSRRSRKNDSGGLVILLMVGLLAGGIFVVSSLQVAWTTSEAVLLGVLTLLCVGPAFSTALSKKTEFDLFEPSYWFGITFFIAFVVSPIIMIDRGLVGTRSTSYRDQLAPALLLANIGLAGSYLGYYWGRTQLANYWAKRELYSPQTKSEKSRVFTLALIFFIIAVASFVLWWIIGGVPLEYINALDDEITYSTASDTASGSSFYFFMARRSWPLLIIVMWYFAPNSFWKLVAGFAWIANFLVYAAQANRSTLFFLVCATYLSYYMIRRKQPNVLTLGLLATFIFFAGAYLVVARGRGVPNQINFTQQVVEEITDRGAATGLMPVMLVFPERNRHIGLVAMSDLIYAPVPRALWPEKPSLRPVQDILNANTPVRAHAPGVLGIYFAGFGHVGVFVALFLYGVLSAWFYNLWVAHPDKWVAWLILAGWLPLLWILIHRGVISKQIIMMFYHFGPALLAYWLSSKLRPKRTWRERWEAEATAPV